MNLKGLPSFNLCFEEVMSDKAKYAVLPIENSIGGSIHANFDLHLRHNLFIVAEIDFRVRHYLMALPGTKISDVKEVHSHPQALAQCDKYLKKNGLIGYPKFDTAGSAKLIREQGLQGVAAIASKRAAEHYGLEILDQNIEDDVNNYTRFLLLSTEPVSIPPAEHVSHLKYKTSLVFSLVNSAGILFHALAAFSLRGIDLTKIESRPDTLHISGRDIGPLAMIKSQDSSSANASSSSSDDKPSSGDPFLLPNALIQSTDPLSDRFRVMFFVDCAYSPDVIYALRHLAEIAPYIRVLGCYPRDAVLVDDVAKSFNIPNGSTAKQPSLPHIKDVGRSPSAYLSKQYSSSTPSLLRSGTPAPSLRIGIVGFGNFGQFLAKRFVKQGHQVFAASRICLIHDN